MQLRRHGPQLLIILMILTATEQSGATEPAPPILNHPGRSIDVVLSPQDSAALRGTRSLPDLVTDENATILGFKNKEEATSVIRGEGFDVYQVDLQDLREFKPDRGDVTRLLKQTASRIYPLLTVRAEDGPDAKTRSALVVALRKDKVDSTRSIWTTTHWGLAQLAQTISEYRARVYGFKSGSVVWIPSLNLHFLGDNVKDENLMLIPLADRKTYGLTKGVPISAKIVFALYALEAKSLDTENPG
ncbi:MAG: hypothetical protein ABI988_10340 [Nitrospirota bacterium]